MHYSTGPIPAIGTIQPALYRKTTMFNRHYREALIVPSQLFYLVGDFQEDNEQTPVMCARGRRRVWRTLRVVWFW